MRLLFYWHKFVTVRTRSTRASLDEKEFRNQDLCCVWKQRGVFIKNSNYSSMKRTFLIGNEADYLELLNQCVDISLIMVVASSGNQMCWRFPLWKFLRRWGISEFGLMGLSVLFVALMKRPLVKIYWSPLQMLQENLEGLPCLKNGGTLNEFCRERRSRFNACECGEIRRGKWNLFWN